MKNLTKTLLVCITMALALLAGCGIESGNAGSEYIGKWEDVNKAARDAKAKAGGFVFRSGQEVLVIERNGDSFIIRSQEGNTPATFKDGVLQVSGATYAIDKASGNLTDGKLQYKRVQ